MRAAAAFFAGLLAAGCSPYEIRPGLEIAPVPYPESHSLRSHPLPTRVMLDLAVQRLAERGVRRIRICDMLWYVAPLGLFMATAVGELDVGGVSYRAFDVGIHDGTELHHGYPAGKVYYLVARGTRPDGSVVWNPEPTPDEMQVFGGYQFADRDRIEAALRTCR